MAAEIRWRTKSFFIPLVIAKFTTMKPLWCNRVSQEALRRLEPDEGKLSSPVLRGGDGGNIVSLPDFNVQKTGGYALEHAFTQNPTAAKVFYCLLQIAHLLSQLMARGSLFRQAFPKGVGSAKNLAFRVLEAWRNLRRTPAEVLALVAGRFQIRFDTS